MSGCSNPRVAGDSPRANASWMARTMATLWADIGSPPRSSVSGRLALGDPGDDGVRAVHRRSVLEREDRELLLSADPLEFGALAGRADGERTALAEDDALVRDPRLVERLMSATAPMREERWPSASNVAGIEGQFGRRVLQVRHRRLSESGSITRPVSLAERLEVLCATLGENLRRRNRRVTADVRWSPC